VVETVSLIVLVLAILAVVGVAGATVVRLYRGDDTATPAPASDPES